LSTPTYTALTRSQLERGVVQRLGLFVPGGGGHALALADSGSTSTLVHDELVDAGNTRFIDQWLGFFNGTGAGQYRRVSAFTAGSDRLTFTPTGTAPDTTTEYGVISSEIGDPHQLQIWVRQAAQALNWNKRLNLGFMKESGPRREIMLGNALRNPVFDLYTTTNAPDNWADGNSTLAQETTITFGGARRSLKVVTNGSNVATVTQSLSEVGRYKGQTLACYAWVYVNSDDAGEVFLRVTDGGTPLSSSLHGGTGWEKLTVDYPVTADASELTVSIRSTTASTTMTFRIQVVFVPKVPSDDHTYPIDADQNFAFLDDRLRISEPFSDTGGSVGRFGHEVKSDAWEIVLESTRAMRINIGSSMNGRIVEYTGLVNHSALTAATTTWPANDIYILDVAEAIARSALGGRFIDRFGRVPDVQAGRYGLVAERALIDGGVRPTGTTKTVEPS
jgi:hypothetical protein